MDVKQAIHARRAYRSLEPVEITEELISPENLVQERCTRCHTLAPIEAARKTRHEWESTVYRMITRGARLNEREAKR